MAQTEVSSVIRDIINAFKNGSMVFRRSRGRKHKRRPSQSSLADEDRRVETSLTQRPEEIEYSYKQSVARHGRKFEVGDSTSQTSLAQILLVLNTGLIKLLNHALSRDSKSRGQSHQEIFSLSESAAMDTLHALSELNTRLTSMSRLDLRLPRTTMKGSSGGKIDSKQYSASRGPTELNKATSHTRQRSSSSAQDAQRPPMDPRLAKGGWIRSRSDPSVVSVVVTNKIVPRKNDRKRPSASRSQSFPSAHMSNIDLTTTPKKSPLPVYSLVPDTSAPSLVPNREDPFHDHLKPLQMIPEKHIRRHPSMYIVPSDFFDVFPAVITPRYEPQKSAQQQPMPKDDNVVEQSSRNISGSNKPRPPSMMTFKTASTKIGEIPEHKWPDRTLTEEQQLHLPMPYVVPAMLEQPPKKRRGFKFWKKQTGIQEALAA